jgi:putative addiction module killer protein
MVEVRQTAVFHKWMAGLRDRRARGRIGARIDRRANGLTGDIKAVGDGEGVG